LSVSSLLFSLCNCCHKWEDIGITERCICWAYSALVYVQYAKRKSRMLTTFSCLWCMTARTPYHPAARQSPLILHLKMVLNIILVHIQYLDQICLINKRSHELLEYTQHLFLLFRTKARSVLMNAALFSGAFHNHLAPQAGKIRVGSHSASHIIIRSPSLCIKIGAADSFVNCSYGKWNAM
jgi:hypothetical protein